MIINHNIAALNTHRQLNSNNTQASNNLEKLSSGLRINRAGDDAAGLAISEKMRGQIRGLDMAQKNAQDGISLIQTAEGALNETHDILQRMRELAVQSSNDTNTDSDRAEMQKEVDQLAQELSRISNTTEFNTQNLAGGGFEGTFHIGANEGQNITLSIEAMDAFSLGVARDVTEIKGTPTGDISNVTFAETVGTGIADGSTITITSAASADTQATGDFGSGKPTISAVASGDNDGSAGNVNVVIDASGGATAGANLTGNTLTITLDSDNAMDSAAINAALTANGLHTDFTASGTGAVVDTDTATLTGGLDADPDKVNLTLADGTLTETISVDKTATSVSISDAANGFNGLSFDVTGLETPGAVGTIALESETFTAAKAVVDADGKVTTNAEARGGINISDQEAADKAITTINNAIETVSAERSKLGAVQNRLEHTINNLGTSSENLTAAESRIRDVDMAAEMMEFTKNNILTQAAQAMLAQANQQPQGVLQLLR